MAKWEVGKNIDTYIERLNTMLSLESEAVGKAIYSGAGIVADAVRRNIQSLPESETKKKGVNKVRGVTASQKAGLLAGFGISHERIDGSYRNVKLGMDGYNSTVTKKYPQGQPNALIARITESGSEYHTKTPFIAPAVRATQEQAERKMQESIEQSISAIMK